MTNEQLKNEMFTAINYLRKNPMKDWFERNFYKVFFMLWFLERVYYYTVQNPKFNSFMKYVELVLGLIK